ncbi:hypothetical protein CC1G_00045 [Coprinopsis cinerea okayama7|uniref:Uncharacterized protein n=1 Tax=Coprinopsis cinerea (strain Okayama-7 / 130 / ATCC MYA-4618 / FGSC 9003) TaxID=240176 RepID=A8NWJ6_COPC7|nr:hypothetical protein CC1G_00045 [Coprinopsis cinerea okayama7\|eukprot:XP_001836909.2 hypothetical protein CC1G_00045 [Coprinopsis cinerea okayama7\
MPSNSPSRPTERLEMRVPNPLSKTFRTSSSSDSSHTIQVMTHTISDQKQLECPRPVYPTFYPAKKPRILQINGSPPDDLTAPCISNSSSLSDLHFDTTGVESHIQTLSGQTSPSETSYRVNCIPCLGPLSPVEDDAASSSSGSYLATPSDYRLTPHSARRDQELDEQCSRPDVGQCSRTVPSSWLALYLVTTLLRKDVEGSLLDLSSILKYSQVTQVRLNTIIHDLHLDERIMLLALYYLDRLYPDGAFLLGIHASEAVSWAFVIARAFLVGVMLAELWIDDNPHHISVFARLCLSPTKTAAQIQRKALVALGYNLTVNGLIWKTWLSRLQLKCIIYELSVEVQASLLPNASIKTDT